MHIVNYEFEKRTEDYLNAHGITMTPKQVIAKIQSGDVKQLILALANHPTSEKQFTQALYQYRQELRDMIYKYFESEQLDAMLYPTCSILPPKIEELKPPDWTIKLHNGEVVP